MMRLAPSLMLQKLTNTDVCIWVYTENSSFFKINTSVAKPRPPQQREEVSRKVAPKSGPKSRLGKSFPYFFCYIYKQEKETEKIRKKKKEETFRECPYGSVSLLSSDFCL